MQPSGLAHVEAARQDGRWERAYAGSSEMVIPDDFLAALKSNRAAKQFFATLDRRNLFAIYHRLQTAKRPETRKKRIASMIADLARGKTFH
ncbi:MAG TPA: YdeI/OmpD-associated family protein, partial [Enhygromyxa sp.]|nr:YdeI/OmpD-associated family protein [Enhygromyxa sp.]